MNAQITPAREPKLEKPSPTGWTREISGRVTADAIESILRASHEPMTATQIMAAIKHPSEMGVEASLAGLKRRGVVVALVHKAPGVYRPKRWKIV